MVGPRRFFRGAVAPGEQAPGLVFAGAVVFVEESTRLALVPDAYPVVGGQPIASGLLWLGLAVVLVTPVGLHLATALVTVTLASLTRVTEFGPERAGVGETVQVVAYATAPCVLVGVPIPPLRLACIGYSCLLLVLGLSAVHRLPWFRSAVTAILPGLLVFGYGFRGIAALTSVIGA